MTSLTCITRDRSKSPSADWCFVSIAVRVVKFVFGTWWIVVRHIYLLSSEVNHETLKRCCYFAFLMASEIVTENFTFYPAVHKLRILRVKPCMVPLSFTKYLECMVLFLYYVLISPNTTKSSEHNRWEIKQPQANHYLSSNIVMIVVFICPRIDRVPDNRYSVADWANGSVKLITLSINIIVDRGMIWATADHSY